MKKRLPTGVEIHNNKLRIWFIFEGKRCRESLSCPPTPKNIKLASEKRSSICHSIRMGTFEYNEHFPNSKKVNSVVNKHTLTIKSLFERWLSLKQIEVTPATLNNYNNRLKQVLTFIPPETLVHTISQEMILELRAMLLSTCTASTVNTYLRTIKSVFQFAINNDYCHSNVITGIKELKQRKKPPVPLSQDEFSRLIAACLNDQDVNLWTIAVYTGMRHGELLSLAWEDIDLISGTITVNRNLTLKGTFKPPKTESGERVINLLEPALAALKRQQSLTLMYPTTEITVHQREQGVTEVENVRFVFSPMVTATRDTGPYYFHTSIHDKWTSVTRRARIPRRKPYQTRHTYACWMLSAGANPTFIAKQMGHSSAREVYQTYGDWVSDHTQNQLDLLNNKYGGDAPNMPLRKTNTS